MSDERQRKERVLQIELVKPRHSRFLQTKCAHKSAFFVLKCWSVALEDIIQFIATIFDALTFIAIVAFISDVMGITSNIIEEGFLRKKTRKIFSVILIVIFITGGCWWLFYVGLFHGFMLMGAIITMFFVFVYISMLFGIIITEKIICSVKKCLPNDKKSITQSYRFFLLYLLV